MSKVIGPQMRRIRGNQTNCLNKTLNSATLPAILHSVVVVGTDTLAVEDVSSVVEVDTIVSVDERVSE